MNPTRRTVLKSLAATAALATRHLPAEPAFPPQEVIDADPLRPRYHLMPRRGWMNDPCAPVFFAGTYHVFFQYNPGASVWGDMHWAHASSPDMVHWSPRPMALAPTAGGPDQYGVWTGSIVIDHASGKPVPTVLYTATELSTRERATMKDATPHPIRETQCLATANDASLDTWTKLPKPVVAEPPPGMEVTGFRDPVPFRMPDAWYMLLASGELGKGGDVLLYKSADLRQWSFQHVFAQGKPTGQKTPDTVDSGEMWECPDFFPLGDKHVLIHSTGTANGRATLWQSGSLDPETMRWTPEYEGVLNHGPYYAPKTQLDAHGNRILWGWIPEDRPEAEYAKAGWAGCMSLPRTLTLENGQVRLRVAPEVASLRKRRVVPDRPSTQAEYLVHIRLLKLQPGESASIAGDLGPVALATSSGSQVFWSGKDIHLDEPLPEQFDLHCFVDHSVIEVFLGDRVVLTARLYSDAKVTLSLPANYTLTTSSQWELASL